MQKYVMPALKTIMGVGETVAGIGTGNPMLAMQGIPTAVSGASSIGQSPAGSNAGPAGFAPPNSSGTPSLSDVGAALPANSALKNWDPSSGVAPPVAPPLPASSYPAAGTGSGNPAPGGGQMPSWQSALSGSGSVGDAYFKYLSAIKTQKLQNQVAYAPAHTTPTSAPPPFSTLPQLQFAMPQY